jgi:hypothetical protein
MDPKRTAEKQDPPAVPQDAEPQTDMWEPPFERWQRLTEALIANRDVVRQSPSMNWPSRT